MSLANNARTHNRLDNQLIGMRLVNNYAEQSRDSI